MKHIYVFVVRHCVLSTEVGMQHTLGELILNARLHTAL